ncbi:hypothetical protein EBZ80_00780 [bacterium]|nr:hypothetical protein [bacterium]
MIRKYLVIGNRISLASTRRDSIQATGPLIELLMPIDVYWQLEEEFKKYDMMASEGDDTMVLAELNKKILSRVIPYAVNEKERIWLHKNVDNKG